MTEEARVRVTNVRRLGKGTLVAFCDVELLSGLILRDCSVHSKGEARWVHPPSSKFTGRDGKTTYKRLVDFRTRALMDEFRDQVLAALDAQQSSHAPAPGPAPQAQPVSPPRAEIPNWLKP